MDATRPKRPRKPLPPRIFAYEPIDLVGPTYIERARRSATLEELVDSLPDDVGLHEVRIEADAGEDYESDYRSASISAVRCVLVPGAAALITEYEQAIAVWSDAMKLYRIELEAYHQQRDRDEAAALRAKLDALEAKARSVNGC